VNGVRFADIQMFHLLWVLPVVLSLYIYAARRRRVAMRVFADIQMQKHINLSTSATRRRWKAAGVLAALLMLVAALVRPGWNPQPRKLERLGRDVIFVLDVSRSMLAEDLKPNRLERAKLAILDCIGRLQGDRVGLVAFAGTAAVKCPLTLDYGFFRMMLAQVDTTAIARGGTMIGDAVRTTLDKVFDDLDKKYKDIILITDGEDHDSFPVQAAEEAGNRGVRIIAIGLGDENEGRRVPITDDSGRKTFLTYEGEEVWSKLDADTLREMANATPDGKYLNVSTGTIDLGDVYEKLVVGAEKKELESRTVTLYEEKFQIFLALALAVLCLEAVTGVRKRRS